MPYALGASAVCRAEADRIDRKCCTPPAGCPSMSMNRPRIICSAGNSSDTPAARSSRSIRRCQARPESSDLAMTCASECVVAEMPESLRLKRPPASAAPSAKTSLRDVRSPPRSVFRDAISDDGHVSLRGGLAVGTEYRSADRVAWRSVTGVRHWFRRMQKLFCPGD